MRPAQIGEVFEPDADQAVGLMGYFGFRFERPFLRNIRKVCSKTLVAVKKGRYSFLHSTVLLVSGHPHAYILFCDLPIDNFSQYAIPFEHGISQSNFGAGFPHAFLKTFRFIFKSKRWRRVSGLSVAGILTGYQAK